MSLATVLPAPPPVAAAEDPSLVDGAQLAQALGTDPALGLAAAEAARRLQADGPNALRALPVLPLWRRALAHLQDPLVYLLGTAAVLAFVGWWFEGRGRPGAAGWPLDAIVIAVVVLLNAGLGWLEEAKAAQAVAALARLSVATSAVLRDGAVVRVPSVELVRGDVLVLAEGDAVAADARLLQAAALTLLEAALTGESGVVAKDVAVLPQAVALADRRNMVFQGTAVAQGHGRALVTATGMHTELGGIATLLDTTPDAPSPLQTELAQLGLVLGVAALAIGAAVVAVVLLGRPAPGLAELVTVLLLGVSVAVAAVPEGLPAILSLVLALGVRRMARHHAIVRQLAAVETLGSASVIATDKTGTLTRGEMTVQRVLTASGRADLTGVGYVPEGRAEQAGAELREGPVFDELQAVLRAGAQASNAQLRQADDGTWSVLGDPTEAALQVAVHKLRPAGAAAGGAAPQRLGEIPFTSQRKRMAVLVAAHAGEAGEADAGPVLLVKGAPELLLPRCTHLRRGRETLPLDEATRAQLHAEVDAMAGDALRTLAVACRSLPAGARLPAAAEDTEAAEALEQGLEYLGSVGLIDPPRAEAAAAIAEARRAGIRVVMITGDHPATAARIAADLGLAEPGAPVLTGLALDALDDAALAAAVQRSAVFARVAPRHKLRLVRALQQGGQVVAMTGDGVNDAPALKAADIGVAMGLTGTEVTKAAARMVLADDHFATLVLAVREGRGVLDNIRKFLRYLLSSNLAEVMAVLAGVLGAGLLGLKAGAGGAVALPLLATQLLWVNLVTDTGPALAMGVDPVAEDVMARPPRPRSEHLVDAAMLRDVAGTGLVMAALTLLALDLFLPGGLVEPPAAWLGPGPHELPLARTAAFTVLVLTQLFNAFNARSATASALRHLGSNPWLWLAVASSLLLQAAVVHLPFLNLAFGTVPLSPAQWAVCAGLSSGVLLFSEARKALRRR
jgi:magnesium-transporting ATPase (P-type)